MALETVKKREFDQQRAQAIDILTAVLSGGRALDQVLDTSRTTQPAWLQEITSGVLRWRSRLDFIIDSHCEKKKPSGWFRKALWLATYQLVVQDRVSPAAVVDETVEIIKHEQGKGPASFANAVLRKILNRAGEWRSYEPAPSQSAADSAAIAGVPEWMWKRLVRAHGFDFAKLFCLASLERPKLWIRTRPTFKPHRGASLWAKALEFDRPEGSLPDCYEVVERGNITQFPGFAEGQFFVQDVSSQTLIAEVAREVLPSLRNQGAAAPSRALDLCAAPGGKTAGLEWSGFHVTATDENILRLQFLFENKERLKLECEVVPLEEVAGQYHLVWVDAPCTGSGIIRRHPDVRWHRTEKDLETLVKKQREVLAAGAARVADRGFLMYSVCSVFAEEGPEVIKDLAPRDFEIRKTWLLGPHISPHGDGFFGALLQKK